MVFAFLLSQSVLPLSCKVLSETRLCGYGRADDELILVREGGFQIITVLVIIVLGLQCRITHR